MANPEQVLYGKLHVHDEFIDELLADETLDEQFPRLRDALRFADTEFSVGPRPDDPVRDHHDHDPGFTAEPPMYRSSIFIRIVLRAIRETQEFKQAHGLLPEDLQKRLDRFLDGKSLPELFPTAPAGHSQAADDAAAPLGAPTREHFTALSQKLGLTTLHGTRTETASQIKFQNWGLNVTHTPETTVVPKTKAEVIKQVKDAKAQGLRIRAAGYRHSWTDMFPQDNYVCLSMLDIATVTKLPDFSAIQADPDYTGNDFKGISLKEDPLNTNVAYITLGSAVTNEDFRRWIINPVHGASKWTLPLQVIMVEITFGGSNAPICHGAGIRTTTLSDLVVAMEYIDANGELKELADPDLLRAAAGCFGLLGIVTNITFKLDRMTAALLNGRDEDLLLAIPPPPSYYSKLPKNLQARLKAIPPATLEDSRKKFIEIAENKYYSEWFWFPYQKHAFIQAWDNSTDTTDMINYPGKLEVFLQWLFSWGGGVLNDMPAFRKLPPKFQATIMGTFAMLTMPRKRVKTQLINALHFRRGIQNMRVGDFEVEIPIPAIEKAGAPTQTRNWELVQQAWWDGIITMYNDTKNVSARIALEMRVTGASAVIMAPQAGNTLGTASIEVITSMPAVENSNHIWKGIKQTLADIWLNYKDADGKPLRVRPHWAKEWTETNAFGKDWVQYLRETHYKAEIGELKDKLRDIGAMHGWKLEDIQARFSNPLLDSLIFA